jgi:hypothetical protein
MIYLESSLVLYPGKEAAYRENEKELYRLLEKFGAKVIGSWNTVIGNVNEIVGLIAYEDMGQLQKSALAMTQDKEYITNWQKITPAIMSQNRKIMMPMPISPLK